VKQKRFNRKATGEVAKEVRRQILMLLGKFEGPACGSDDDIEYTIKSVIYACRKDKLSEKKILRELKNEWDITENDIKSLIIKLNTLLQWGTDIWEDKEK